MFQFLIGEFCQAAPRPLAFYDQLFPEGKIAPGICGFSCGEVGGIKLQKFLSERAQK